MAKIRKEVIVDTVTGEVLYERTKSLRMFLFDEEKGYILFHNRGMVKMNPDIDWSGLSHEDLGRLTALCLRHLNRDNILEQKKEQPMTAADIRAALGLSQNRTYIFLRKLTELGMIARRGTAYVVCPLYFLGGKYVSADLYGQFKQQLAPFVPDWAKREYEGIGAIEGDQRDFPGGRGAVDDRSIDGGKRGNRT